MNALVTGSTGFIGTHLTKRLDADGWEVASFARSGGTPANLTVVDGTVESLTEQIQTLRPDVVFHLATKFVGVHKPDEVDDLVESNIGVGSRLLEALNTLDDVAFVNVGTVWQHVFSHPYSPASLYAATKQAFADVLRFYAECGNVRAVNLELTDTYGPGDTRKKLVNVLMETLDNGGSLDMSGGEQYFDALHVSDAVEGLVMSAQHASHELPTFGLFSEDPPKLKDFIAQVSDIVGRPMPVNWGVKPYRVREMMEPWRASPLLPEWKAKVGLQEGLRELLSRETNS